MEKLKKRKTFVRMSSRIDRIARERMKQTHLYAGNIANALDVYNMVELASTKT
jgi:hypothetical protein